MHTQMSFFDDVLPDKNLVTPDRVITQTVSQDLRLRARL